MKEALVVLLLLPIASFGQKIYVKDSNVTFFSDALVEDISASTTKSSGVIELSRAEFAFSVPIKEFQFEKSLMREHFNEKYMETEKFPDATFTGKIINFDPDAESQSVHAEGKLTIHGVSRQVQIPASLNKEEKGYRVNAKFMVKLADYKIKIPQLLFQNIAEEIEVTVDFNLTPR